MRSGSNRLVRAGWRKREESQKLMIAATLAPLMPWPALLFIAFLSGSIPFGYLIARWKGIDIRAHGSGNIGATNVGRVLGRRWGFLCFGLDALKGAVPVIVAGVSRDLFGAPLTAIPNSELWWWLSVAILALLGHMFSPWIGFKGGKGVATGFGALLAMWTPLTFPALVALVVWVTLVKLWKMVSIASLVAALAIPATVAARAALAEQPKQAFHAAVPALIATSAIALLVIWKHRGNIVRAMRGEERKVDI